MRGHHLCLTETLHFLKITPNKTTVHNYQVWGHTSFLVCVPEFMFYLILWCVFYHIMWEVYHYSPS
jgi:hypothetical protein